MRVRKPFAAAFTVLLLVSAYLGLAAIKIPTYKQSDKGLHFLTFFLLTATFYWILETSRRRVLHLTLAVCTIALGAGSEILQELLDNGRAFDPYDIAANVVGSLLALALCAWYHKRMLERKRAARYGSVGDEEAGEFDHEVELEEGMGVQETGVTSSGQREPTMDEELDNWDENAGDWDEDDEGSRRKPTNIELDGRK